MIASEHTASGAQTTANQQFQGLVSQSLTLLEKVLADETVPSLERAQIALQILALSQGQAAEKNSDQGDVTKAATQLATPRTENGQDANNNGVGQPATGKAIASKSAPETTTTPARWNGNGTMLSPRCVRIDNFLSPQENMTALEIALNNQRKFVGSSTTTDASDYRRSSVLYATYYADFYHLLRKRLLRMMPDIMKHLDSDPFLVSQVEMQMTAHNDGCFYRIHNDSGSPETETRVLTYVYYFHQEPKAYDGGALRIYETDLNGPATEPSELFEDVVPANNTVVLFDSRVKHEVLPVSCPSRKFEDSRFTLNGWLRRV
ncbi:MAG: 2OG-Fe(II) oxygenase [Cyanobacteria bacterium P01_D01_bin.73]